MVLENKKLYYHLLGLVVLSYFTIFIKLDSFHIRWWDESLFAVNTYEMFHNGKFFSTYYDGLPDLFNSKPPMTSWLQIVFVKILGYSELALRLPSAISAVLCVLILFIFIARRFDLYWAWFSALVLLTSQGFIHFHTARTADADAILTLFLFLANLFFVKYILDGGNKNIFFVMFFLSVAFMTKMYIPLLFCPAYLVILIREKKLKEFLFSKTFWLGVVVFLGSTFGLIYLRDLDSPGYFKKFFTSSEILYTVVHSHDEPLDFYFHNLFSYRFATWFVLSLLGIGMTLLLQETKEKKVLFSFLMMSLVYLVIITISKTKLEWYDMPLFPYLATLAGFALYYIFKNIPLISGSKKPWQLISIIILIFFIPYYRMYDKTQGNIIPTGEKILEANERLIFQRMKEHKNLDGLKVLQFGHKGSMLFYKYKLADKGQKIEIVSEPNFNSNDKVLVSNDSLKLVLRKNYNLTVLDKYAQGEIVQIQSKLSIQ